MPENITGLSARDAEFLTTMASQNRTIFTTEEALKFWGTPQRTADVLSRLVQSGWLHRLERGVYLIVPLEAGIERHWSAQASVIAMYLIEPATIAYWSALHQWQLTEQIPNTTFVQSTSRKRPSEKEILGMRFQFINVTSQKFFGMTQRTVDGQPYTITDREKTLIDAADRPDLSGGVVQLAQAFQSARDLDWQRLTDYLLRWPVSSPTKRIGFLLESLALSVPEQNETLSRWQNSIAPGVISLEPGGPDNIGRIVTRWQVRINVPGPWNSGRGR